MSKTDPRYQRKPKPTHPWVGWQPGLFSKADAEKRRQPPPKKA